MREDGRTDGHTDMTKLIVAFLNFAKVPNKTTEVLLDWSRLANELPAKTRY
jgi:hypothetical protein